MTQEKLIDMFNKANDFINRAIEIQNRYINKINGYLADIENLVNNAIEHSEQYIKVKLNKIYSEIEKILNAFKKQIDSIIKAITDWYDNQLNAIKTQIILFTFAKAGLPTTKELARKAAETIPHPELGLPIFEIPLTLPSIPEISLGNYKLNLGRIPTINI